MNTDLMTIIRSVILGTIIGLLMSACAIYSRQERKPDIEPIKYIIEPIECDVIEYEEVMPVYEVVEPDIAEEIYFDSLEYLACCVEAEAGNQGLMGKRLVCDVILNRVDSKDFPDNIFDVINQKNQFSVVSNGRIYEVSISDETFEACRLELEKRTDAEILYFTAGGYSACGSPAYKYKEHYFSK